jgi:hypothetical protein
MFPTDDYTPHGYLDNPAHSWALHPSGVLRSLAPIGMGWHVPNYGSYGRNQFRYSAHLLAGLRVGGHVYFAKEDFASQGITLRGGRLFRHIFGVDFQIGDTGIWSGASFFLADEDTLGCMWSLENPYDADLQAECLLAMRFVYNPATTRRWVQGLVAWDDGVTRGFPLGAAMIGVYPEEDHALALIPYGVASAYFSAPTLAELRAWMGEGLDEPHVQVQEPPVPDGCWVRWLGLRLPWTMAPQARHYALDAVLARGKTAAQARERATAMLYPAEQLYPRLQQDDIRLEKRTPHLEGDWPAHWRCGLVYDIETLRMVVRPPAGIFRHRWDGMQIQAPRLVLAETALDALALSYVEPKLAQEILLSAFESAPLPNVPCIREDGSYNMLTETGEPCGTAPEWGFPLHCCDLIYRRLGDLAWLRKLYPGAAAYIRWWLNNRVDAEGWPVYACSYESGQDSSPRFGAGDTGASSVRHIRPVDLQAALAQAAMILGSWAYALGLTDEAFDWQKIAQEGTERTRAMWQADGWFHDYDTRAGVWSPVRDPMQLAPLLCGCATPEQTAALAPLFRQEEVLPKHGERWHPLVWPPVAFTVIEAAAAAGEYDAAARLTMQVLERAYRRSDSREVGSNGGLPGIAREFWPDWGEPGDAGIGGIEGYGWGALGVALLMRHIVGLHEIVPGILRLRPVIPAEVMRPGTTLRVGPIPLAQGRLTVEIQAGRDNTKSMLLTFQGVKDAASLSVAQVGAPEATGAITRLTPPKLGRSVVRYQVALSEVNSLVIRLSSPG